MPATDGWPAQSRRVDRPHPTYPHSTMEPDNNAMNRRSKADTQTALIAAAKRLLADGRPVMVPNVTLKEAIAESGVPRSSAYRAYESDIGQLAAFRQAVADAIAEDPPAEH